jgi:hypothetical protein
VLKPTANRDGGGSATERKDIARCKKSATQQRTEILAFYGISQYSDVAVIMQ